MNKQILLSRYSALKERVDKACVASGRNPGDVRIIVVTKNHSIEIAQMVIDAGITDIAENRVQEIEQKVPHLTGAYTMHLIGHLQSNKVNKVVPLVSWIQSVDSIRIAEKINSNAVANGTKINVLLQVKTSDEETKSGCNESDVVEIAEHISAFDNIRLSGLMTIGALNASEKETRDAFARLRTISEECKKHAACMELSMGMSSDFEWAIQEGATMIRVGTLLLGERDYQK